MSVDTSQLKSWLAQSKLQKDNNALYQTIKNLIDNLDSTDQVVNNLSSGSSGGGSSAQLDLFPEIMLLAGLKDRIRSSSSTTTVDSFLGALLLMGDNRGKVPSIATTSNPGLLPKLNGSATQYLDGTGAFSTPGASPVSNDFLPGMLLGGM